MRIVDQEDFSMQMLGPGQVSAVPTETVFGLAVRFDDSAAIRKLTTIKERGEESGKVFSLLVSGVDKISDYAVVSTKAQEIIDQYLPGELTIVLPKRRHFENVYFDNFLNIGFRVPKDDFLCELASQGPLLLTSANRQGQDPAKSAAEIAERLPEVDLVIDSRPGGSLPTTVVKVIGDEVEILRRGKLTVGLS